MYFVLLTALFFYFPQCFWGEQYYVCVQGLKFALYSAHSLGVENTLVAVVRPEHVDWFNSVDDEEAEGELELSLHQVYGKKFVKPHLYHVTRWALDPYALGTGVVLEKSTWEEIIGPWYISMLVHICGCVVVVY